MAPSDNQVLGEPKLKVPIMRRKDNIIRKNIIRVI